MKKFNFTKAALAACGCSEKKTSALRNIVRRSGFQSTKKLISAFINPDIISIKISHA